MLFMNPHEYPKEVRDKAREAWVSGAQNLAQVSEHLGINRATIQRWRAEDRWDDQRNEVEQENYRREIEKLADQREQFQNSSLKLWAFLHAQMFLRAKRYGVEREMPMGEALEMAKVLAACQAGYYMALGVDPKLEAKANEISRPRKILIDYEPLASSLADEYGVIEVEATNGNGHVGGNGNGHVVVDLDGADG